MQARESENTAPDVTQYTYHNYYGKRWQLHRDKAYCDKRTTTNKKKCIKDMDKELIAVRFSYLEGYQEHRDQGLW